MSQNPSPQVPRYLLQPSGSNFLFNQVDVGDTSTTAFADLDQDGDLDGFLGSSDGTLRYFRNIGSATMPQFTAQVGTGNPFNGVSVGSSGNATSGYSSPEFADVDSDSRIDVVIGAADGTLRYYRNTGTVSSPAYTPQVGGANPFGAIKVESNAAPAIADLDGDGKADLVLGGLDGTLRFFKNQGNGTYVEQVNNSPFQGIDVGEYSTPELGDINRDGKLDLLIGEVSGKLVYFHNTGTTQVPQFTPVLGSSNPFSGIDVGFSHPTLVDLDNDGDRDLVLGEFNGEVHYYQATSAPVIVIDQGAMNAIAEDANSPTGSVGMLVSSLVDLTGGNGVNNVSDSDSYAVAGMAITLADSSQGTWFYSLNNGTTWTAIASVSESNALLLAADAQTRLYFKPKEHVNGTVSNGITFRAWDGTTGSNGSYSNTTLNGDSAAFSSATAQLSITVNPVNDLPAVTSFNLSVDEDQGLTFAIADFTSRFTDVDGDSTLNQGTNIGGRALDKIQITSLPAQGNLQLNAVAVQMNQEITLNDLAKLRFVPNVNVNGTDSFKWKGFDGIAYSITESTVVLSIHPINDAPGIGGSPALFVNEDSFYSFTPEASDVDGNTTLTFAIANQPVWATFDPKTGKLTGTPTNDHVATTAGIVISVSDGVAKTDLPAFNLTVINTNDAPTVATFMPDQLATVGQPFRYTLDAKTFADVDIRFAQTTPTLSNSAAISDESDRLTLSATLADGRPLPTWLTFDTATHTFSGTAAAGDATVVDIKVTATDRSQAQVSDTFTLTVNTPPAIANPIPTQTAIAALTYRFPLPAGTFADLDTQDGQDKLTYTATLADGTPLPNWLRFNSTTASFLGFPLPSHAGSLQVKVTATDRRGAITRNEFALNVLHGKTAIAPLPINFAGGRAQPKLSGTPGINRFRGTVHNDHYYGLGGRDFILGLLGNDQLYGGSGNDDISGSDGGDRLFGGTGNDSLNGGVGHDRLEGDFGNDVLLGDQGNDVLVGGLGADVLIGGRGRDVFTYTSTAEGGDTIANFRPSEDYFDLRGIFAKAAFREGGTSFAQFSRFVQLTQMGRDTQIAIDADGTGPKSIFTPLATIRSIRMESLTSEQFIVA